MHGGNVQHYIKLSKCKEYSGLHYGVGSSTVQFCTHHDCTVYTNCMKKPCTFQSNIWSTNNQALSWMVLEGKQIIWCYTILFRSWYIRVFGPPSNRYNEIFCSYLQNIIFLVSHLKIRNKYAYVYSLQEHSQYSKLLIPQNYRLLRFSVFL